MRFHFNQHHFVHTYKPLKIFHAYEFIRSKCLTQMLEVRILGKLKSSPYSMVVQHGGKKEGKNDFHVCHTDMFLDGQSFLYPPYSVATRVYYVVFHVRNILLTKLYLVHFWLHLIVTINFHNWMGEKLKWFHIICILRHMQIFSNLQRALKKARVREKERKRVRVRQKGR